MAIIFSQGTEIGATGNAINIPGSIVQFVDNTQTVSGSFGSGAWLNFFSTSITTSKNGNQILVEYMMDHRSDQGNGTWSLVYHRILCNGVQVMYSGHNGAAANHIGFYGRTFLFNPPGIGTYTFVSSLRAHQGTAHGGTTNQAGGSAINNYLRLYEIGS
jgi:hypothetical protein